MAHERLTWQRLMGGSSGPHAARSRYPAGRAHALHGHQGFAEVFWIESGRGWHVTPAGREELRPGSCYAVAETDVHGFAALDRSGFTLINVAVPLATWTAWKARFTPWPWEQPVHLGQAALDRLAAWLPDLDRTAHPWTVDAFFSDLARLAAANTVAPGVGLPPLVAQALAEIGPHLPLGFDAAALAKAVGWSVDHLNRELRRTVGQTTTEVLNRWRLDAAERALRLGHNDITAVAYEAGFGNLPHFYRLFQKAYGVTPRGYRIRALGG